MDATRWRSGKLQTNIWVRTHAAKWLVSFWLPFLLQEGGPNPTFLGAPSPFFSEILLELPKPRKNVSFKKSVSFLITNARRHLRKKTRRKIAGFSTRLENGFLPNSRHSPPPHRARSPAPRPAPSSRSLPSRHAAEFSEGRQSGAARRSSPGGSKPQSCAASVEAPGASQAVARCPGAVFFLVVFFGFAPPRRGAEVVPW